jgi:hypothetical protein
MLLLQARMLAHSHCHSRMLLHCLHCHSPKPHCHSRMPH